MAKEVEVSFTVLSILFLVFTLNGSFNEHVHLPSIDVGKRKLTDSILGVGICIHFLFSRSKCANVAPDIDCLTEKTEIRCQIISFKVAQQNSFQHFPRRRF